ncbi:MAG: NAD-dependent epimerase/dehydratase family protein [Pirellulaceae bacterium]|nr:NAD-dependent epimerase/dehydratase family protein [Pirellulaceae bacterium]
MPHAFVTGATGFLGQNLVRLLLEDGFQVTALYRSDASLAAFEGLPVHWVRGSVTDEQSLLRGLPHDVDVVFHAAGNTSQWRREYPLQYDVNVHGTRHMVRAALARRARRFVHTSSIAAFGIQNQPFDESTPSNAATCGQHYSWTKWLGEEEVRRACRDEGLRAVILNPAHIVGPYDTHNWVRLFVSVYRDDLPAIPPGFGRFAHARDIARAHITAADKGRAGENYLLGGPEASFLEFINTIQQVMGKRLSKRATSAWVLRLAEPLFRVQSLFTGQQPRLTPDLVKLLIKQVHSSDAKAERELDFRPVSILQQVEDTYAWLRETGQLA